MAGNIIFGIPGNSKASANGDGLQSKEDKAKEDTLAAGGFHDRMANFIRSVNPATPNVRAVDILRKPLMDGLSDANLTGGGVIPTGGGTMMSLSPMLVTHWDTMPWAFAFRAAYLQTIVGGQYNSFGIYGIAGGNGVAYLTCGTTDITHVSLELGDNIGGFSARSIGVVPDGFLHDFLVAWDVVTMRVYVDYALTHTVDPSDLYLYAGPGGLGARGTVSNGLKISDVLYAY